jgi:hypothetical protein
VGLGAANSEVLGGTITMLSKDPAIPLNGRERPAPQRQSAIMRSLSGRNPHMDRQLTIRKTLLAIVAAVVMAATIQVGTARAQNTGIGGDGYTRLMWRGTDYSIWLWNLDPNLNFFSSQVYGPYGGWTPVALTTDTFSYSYVLWRYYDGTIVLWLLDPSLNFVGSATYGPYPGWTAKGLSVSTSGSSPNFRVLWRYTDGTEVLWDVDGGLNFVNSSGYGPYFGWDPGFTTP